MTPSPTRRGAAAALALLLFALALAPRLAYVAQTRDATYFSAFTLDGEWYRLRAEEARDGKLLSAESHFRGPLYGWLLAGYFSIAGESVHAVRVASALLGAANGVLVWVAALRFVSPAGALLAAILYAGYGTLVFFDGEVLTLTLETTLLLAFLIALTSGRRAGPALSGLALGLGTLLRPSVLPLMPLAIAYLAASRPDRRARVTAAAAHVVVLALVVAPVLVGYRVLLGDWIPVSSQSGINFFLGNHTGADGSAAIAPSTGELDMMIADRYRDTVAEGSRRVAERAAARPLRPSEVSSHWFARGLEFARSDPAEFAALFAKRAYLVVSNQETDNNQDLPAFVERHAPWLRAMPVGAALLVALGLCSLPWRWRGALERRFALAAVVAMWLSTAVFLVISRYRVPLLILLLPFAGESLAALGRAARAKAWRAFARRALPIGAIFIVCAAGLHTVRSSKVRAAQHVNLGILDERAGDDERAAEEYRFALSLDPSMAQARYALGNALARLGRRGEARAEYEALLVEDPRYAPFVANSAGILALEEGDAAAAVSAFRHALAGDPAPTTRANLGVALFVLAESERAPDGAFSAAARAHLEESVAELGAAWSSGDVPGDVAVDLTRARLAAGDSARAQADLGAWLDRDARVARTPRAWLLSGEIARARGDKAAETDALRRALAIDPSIREARERLSELGASR
ncbi:MAG: glycosyltransferase family 39 protein [bacterium]